MLRVLTLIFVLAAFPLLGQIVDPKYPAGWEEKSKDDIPVFRFPEVNRVALLSQDSISNQKKDVPFRFAVAFNARINIKEKGIKGRDRFGNNFWMIKLTVPGAYGVGLIFDRFVIPADAELFVYNDAKSALTGAITNKNNNKDSVLSVVPVSGSTIIIQYFEPPETDFDGVLRLGTITHVYRDIFNIDKGFGDAGNCNVNVVCEAGESWKKQVRSVAMIVTNSGTRWCTGTLVNNTKNDKTPYFLTANHCLLDAGDNPATWSLIFNYKSPECFPSVNGLLGNSVFGAVVKASDSVTDFALLELNMDPPESYNIYFSGWSRNVDEISNATALHHPNGDVMKISIDNDSPVLSAYLGGAGNDYWRVIDWDTGTTEGGSSGAALFDNKGHIIGQLRGGQATCNNELSDYFGAFYKSWEGSDSAGRLKDWLDPEGLNPDTLNGFDPLVDEVSVNQKNPSFSIFPNPAKNVVHIRLNQNIAVEKINLVDGSGRIIRSIINPGDRLNSMTINLSGVTSGLYQLVIYSETVVLTQKLIIN